MKVKHTLNVVTKCPVNGQPDVYECDIWLQEVIPCERLEFLMVGYRETVIFQEELTQFLADRIVAKVRTRGIHGKVRTVCVCYPRSPLLASEGKPLRETTENGRLPLPQCSAGQE